MVKRSKRKYTRRITNYAEQYVISHDIPIPNHRNAFAELMGRMVVGDSVLLKNRREANTFSVYARTHGGKAIMRVHAGGKVRVWLVKKPVAKALSE